MTKNYTEKQREILDVTIDYISKNGIQSFSLRHIADVIGIKQPTLYGHFKSKEEILKGVFDVYKTQALEYQESLTTLNVPRITRIHMCFKKLCELIDTNPQYMNFIWFDLYQYRELFKEDLNFILNNVCELAKNTGDVQENDDGIDYEFLVTMLHGILHIFLKNKLLSSDYDVMEHANKCWCSIKNLLDLSSNS